MEFRTCSGCQRQLAADAEICSHCGEVLPPEVAGAGGTGTWDELGLDLDLDLGGDPSEAPALVPEHEMYESFLAQGPDADADPAPRGTDTEAEDPAGPAVEPIPPPLPCEDAEFTDSLQRRRSTLRAKLDQDPAQPKVILSLARVHEEAGDVPGALHYYRHCLLVDPLNGYATGRLTILEAQLAREAGPGTGAPGTGAVEPGSTTLPPARTTGVAPTGSPARPSGPLPGTGSAAIPRTGTRTSVPGARPGFPQVGQSRPAPTRTLSLPLVIIGASLLLVVGLIAKRALWPSRHWLTSPTKAAMHAVWSPSGDYIAFLEPPQEADMESVIWGFSSWGQAELVVQHAHRPSEVASYERASSWVGGRAVAWGGDRRVAFMTSDDRGRLGVLDITSDDPPALLDGRNPSFSPDGRKIVYERRIETQRPDYDELDYDSGAIYDWRERRELFVYDLQSGSETQLTEGGGESPLWSPDGRTIVFERDDYGVESRTWIDHGAETGRKYKTWNRKVWEARQLLGIPADGGLEWVIAEGGMNRFASFVGASGDAVSWVHWDPPEKRSRFGREEWGEGGYGDGDVRFTDAKLMWAAVDGGGAEELLSFETDAVSLDSARWTPDGRYLIYTGLTFDRSQLVMNQGMQLYASDFEDKVDLFRFDPGTRERVRLVPDEDHPVRINPVPSPDGKRLAYTVIRAGMPQVHVVRWSRVDPG